MFDILFQYGSITIKTFNVILAFAFLMSGVFLIRYAQRQMMNISFIAHNAIFVILAVLIGGRLVYIFENLKLFSSNPIYAFFIWDLHFSFFGILYSIIIALIILARRANEDFWAWFDVSILSILQAMVFIHIGHFFNGSQYGTPTDLPWGIAFDVQNIPYLNPIHPVQIYAFLFTLIVLIYVLKRSKHVHLSGVVGTLALMLYSLGMLGIDFLHGDPSFYVKISFGIIATLSFIFLVLCSSKTHSKSSGVSLKDSAES
jgi:phosphatidylglycerol:prolipoprotein diacylglycerol transferase